MKPYALFSLGTLHAEQDLIDNAILYFEKAIIAKPDYARAYYNLGHLLCQKGMGQKGMSNYRLALKYNPRMAKAHNGLGLELVKQNNLLQAFKRRQPEVPSKSGIMLGLGEDRQEIEQVMHDLRRHGCDMLTLGQYLQPSLDHLPVDRYVTPQEFDELQQLGETMGFSNVASGPMVRSSYHADLQAMA